MSIRGIFPIGFMINIISYIHLYFCLFLFFFLFF